MGERPQPQQELGLEPRDLETRAELVGLSKGLEARDPAVQLRAGELVEDEVERVACFYCRRLAHRGGFCSPGDHAVLHAYGAVAEAERRRLVGVPGEQRPAPRLVRWLAVPDPPSLVTFAFRQMNDGEALRAWNGERGLVQRLRPEAWEAMSAGVGAAIGAAGEPVERVAAVVGFDPSHFFRWVEALWWDACQPAPTMIDGERVQRHLTQKDVVRPPDSEPGSDAEQLAAHADRLRALGLAVVRFAEFLDGYIRRADPAKYEAYLVQPRSQTRPFDDGGGPAAPAGASTPVGLPAPGASDEQVQVRRLAVAVLAAWDAGGVSVHEVLADPAIVAPSDFEVEDLHRLQALPEDDVIGLLRAVLGDDRSHEAA